MNIFISVICIINIVKNKKDQEQLFYIIRKKQIIIHNLKIKLENNETNKCSICFNNSISHCCSPCGHTYCHNCINKTNNCYICRGIICNKIKLFL